MSHLKTKFHFEYARLLSGEQPWNSSSDSSPSPSLVTIRSKGKSPDEPRNRYFSDLLCLPVEFTTVKILIDDIKLGTLLDDEPGSGGSRIRENITGLWKECLNVWRDSVKRALQDQMNRNLDESRDRIMVDQVGELVQDDRRKNAIETLLAISLPLLSKRNLSSLDLIHILAGSMNDADEVFNLLVSCLDSGLKPISLLTAQQMPKFASTYSSDSLSSLQSDATLSKPFSSSEDQNQDSAQLREAELRHLVLRLSLTWVSSISHTSLSSYFLRKDLFLSSISLLESQYTSKFSFEVSLLLGLMATLGGNSTSQLSGMNNVLNNSPYARRIKDWVDDKSMEKLVLSMQVSLVRDYHAYVDVKADEVGGLTGFKWMTDWTSLTGKSPTAKDSNQSTARNEFSHLPPPTASILLPLYLLTRSNSAFLGVMLRSGSVSSLPDAISVTNPDYPGLPISFLTIISYLFTHSSTSNRSRAYTKVSLLLLCSLISDEEGSRCLLDDSEASSKALKEIKTCRQKIPILPFGSRKQRKRLITSVLDSCTLFLRHNLSKKLDVGGYLLTLECIRRTIQICSSLSVRLEYDWKELWSTLFALANFLVARRKEMKISSDTSELIKTLITTLSISLVKSDEYLENLAEARELIYEFLRNSSSLIKLILSLDSSSSISASTNPDKAAETKEAQFSINTVPTKLLVSLPSWKPISKLLSALQVKLDDWSSKNSNRTPSYKIVQKFIAELDVETLFSGAEEDLLADSPRTNGKISAGSNSSGYFEPGKRGDDTWLDKEEEKALLEIVRVVSEDVRTLMY